MKISWFKTFSLIITIMLVLTSCGLVAPVPPPENTTAPEIETAGEPAPAIETITDPMGNQVSPPEKLDRIISMAPSTTELLVELGFKDNLVAVDTASQRIISGLEALPAFDMLTPDVETIIALNPDVVFTTTMSSADGDDPFKPLSNVGINYLAIPTANTIDTIKTHINFIGEVTKTTAKTSQIVADMTTEIEKIKAVGDTITDKKTIFFEIAAAPAIYSFGNGVFLNEMIEIIGAENVLADEESWIAVSEEVAISKNPDIIMTNVNYVEDPVGEILSRNGWRAISAVKNKQVFYIDQNYSSLPNHNIVLALKEMAKATYPDAYESI